MPKDILERRDKIGWNAPIGEWMRSTYYEEISKLLHKKNGQTDVSLKKWADFSSGPKLKYTLSEKVWKEYMVHVWFNSMLKELK